MCLHTTISTRGNHAATVNSTAQRKGTPPGYQPPAGARPPPGTQHLATHGPETIEPASLATRRQARSSGSTAATACVKSQSQPLVIHWSLATLSTRRLSTDEQLARSIRKLYGAVFEATRCLNAFRLDKAPDELRRLLDLRTTARLRQSSDDKGNNALKKILQTCRLTVIAPDNYTRHTFNLLYTRLAAADPERVVFQIKASITRKKERNGATVRLPIGERDLFRLAKEPDSITCLPTILKAFVGMEVRVKVNQCVKKGCANGAIGVVHHIDWFPGTTFTETGSRMYCPSREPHTV
ncbi:hypothetical protein H9P43_008064 [Blastocladiella emersonii ATCC 22665]|nr:hypothetical protein H9P43_008064 [Blastocladiella emersonii ATCC 22665]